MKRIGIWMLLLALVLGTALLAGCKSLPAVQSNGNLPEKTLTVQGTGSVTVAPDIARLTLGVATTDADAAAAQDKNDDTMAKVLAAIRDAGVAEKDIQTTQYTAYPRYNYESPYNEIVGYEVTHMLRVAVRDIGAVGKVLKAASQAGANQSYDISFDVEDRDAAYQEALAKAIENAKGKAQAMASPAGIVLGEPAAVYEGSPAVTYRGLGGYAEAEYVMDAAPVRSGELTVNATVTIVYNLR